MVWRCYEWFKSIIEQSFNDGATGESKTQRTIFLTCYGDVTDDSR